MISSHRLFYVTGAVYGTIFAGIAIALADPATGLAADREPNVHRWLGWISYFAIESYGSIAVSLFWSFVNLKFSYEQAKSSYGLIITGAQVRRPLFCRSTPLRFQIGSILGPSIVSNVKYFGGIPVVYFVGALSPICAAIMVCPSVLNSSILSQFVDIRLCAVLRTKFRRRRTE